MIVQPGPLGHGPPGRRWLRLAGLAVPLVLLAGVVAAGVLGPRPAGPPDGSTRPGGSGDTGPVDAADPSGRAALVVDGRTVDFPETWIGLRVRSVTELRAERQAGGAEGIAAVAGFLSYGTLDPGCMDAYVDADRSACEGRPLLADTTVLPTEANGGVFGAIGPHLHPAFPPATRAPRPARRDQRDSPRREPIPVVALGRYTEPPGTPCSPTSRDCGQAFAVERVVWVAGVPWNPTLTVDPAMGVEPNIPEVRATVEAATRALGQGAYVLATSVVRPDLLETVDPEAAAALPAHAREARLRPVTYARGLAFQFDASEPVYGRDPAIAWVVLDSITGEVLARSGPRGDPPTGLRAP